MHFITVVFRVVSVAFVVSWTHRLAWWQWHVTVCTIEARKAQSTSPEGGNLDPATRGRDDVSGGWRGADGSWGAACDSCVCFHRIICHLTQWPYIHCSRICFLCSVLSLWWGQGLVFSASWLPLRLGQACRESMEVSALSSKECMCVRSWSDGNPHKIPVSEQHCEINHVYKCVRACELTTRLILHALQLGPVCTVSFH